MLIDCHVQQHIVGVAAQHTEKVDEARPPSGFRGGDKPCQRRSHDRRSGRVTQRFRPGAQGSVCVHRVDATNGDHVDESGYGLGRRVAVAQTPGGVATHERMRLFQQIDERLVGEAVLNPDEDLHRCEGGNRAVSRNHGQAAAESLFGFGVGHLSCLLGESP